MRVQLVPNRRANEIGSIGIKAVAHQKIDVTQVDKPHIQRQLLAVRRLRHFHVSVSPSVWMVYGWSRAVCKGENDGAGVDRRERRVRDGRPVMLAQASMQNTTTL